MAAVAGGMESDSESDCDMIFSNNISKSDTKKTDNNYGNIVYESSPSINSKLEKSKESQNPKNSMVQTPFLKKKYYSANNRQRAHTNKSVVFDDLRYAILQGNVTVAKDLYESNGIHADTILKSGWTGLMFACSVGHSDLVEYLLYKNADPNFHQDMFTPLMAVCISKKDENLLLKCCSLLLQFNANVNAHDRHHTTPLIFASREGHKEIVKLLLENGADANAADGRGYTALAWAAYFGHGQVVRILLEKGADGNKMNNMGQLPADIAYDNGHIEVASVLQKIQSVTDEKSIETLTASLPDNNKKVMDFKVKKNTDNSKSFVKLGELDLFLIGIGCQDLLEKFAEHHLGFSDLLIMDDEDLEKIGIHQVGLRKKILEACRAVHKKEWQNSSLPNLKKNHYISCPDAVSMVANISKHLKHISTSVIYIRNQIQSQPRILELSNDGANIHNLLDEVEDSLKNLQTLKDEMRFFKMHLEKVQNKPEFSSNDLIVETVSKSNSTMKVFIVVGIAAASIVLATGLWKYPGPTLHIRVPSLK